MKTSPQGVAFIAAQEGVVTRAYRDAAGIWTIGVGHTAAAGAPVPKAGMTISRDEAYLILARDLPRYEARVERRLPGSAAHVFDGAVSFDFNTGAIDRASWVAAFGEGKREIARGALMRWTTTGGRTLAGLVRRREAEARLIFEGEHGGAAAALPASEEVGACQAQLATLGFYHGVVDGLAGVATRAAVLAYQKSHPDLVADGIAGPATRASLDRDIAARRDTVAAAAGTVTAAATTAVVASGVDAGHPLLIAALVGAATLALAAGFVIHRYGGELRRWFNVKKGP